jgi:hypothetical protein
VNALECRNASIITPIISKELQILKNTDWNWSPWVEIVQSLDEIQEIYSDYQVLIL